jgi:transcriptional regulator with XRE-family HTH domain
MDLLQLGQELIQRRKRFDMPQTAVARRAKVNRGTIAVLERGAHPKTGNPVRPSAAVLERLSEALSVDPLDQRRLFTRLLSLAGYEERLFGAKLAEYRERAKLSPQTLARLVDIDPDLWYQLEEGRTSPAELAIETILTIVKTLRLNDNEAEELVRLAGYQSMVLQVGAGLTYDSPTEPDSPNPDIPIQEFLLALAKLARLPRHRQERCVAEIISVIAAAEKEANRE